MRKRAAAAAVVVLLGTAGAIAVAGATGHGARSGTSLSTLSNQGRRVALSARNARLAKLMKIEAVYLLAIRGKRAYYRAIGSDGMCLGAGPSKSLGELSSEECPYVPFPTAGTPVLDFSVYEGMSHTGRGVSLYRAEGFAADGVASVAFLRPDGVAVLRVPVRRNVFSTSSVPHGPIADVVGYDASGAEVWRSP